MASQTSKLEMEKEAKCSPHKYYEMIKYNLQHLPAVFPESYKSAAILEGDGESVGTVRSWQYVLPGTTKVLEAKGKTEVIDDENMVMVLDIYEGCHKDHYSVFIITMKVVPKGEGCVVKWTLEFDKHSEGGGEAPHYMELFSQITEKIDAHLLAMASVTSKLEMEKEAKCNPHKYYEMIKYNLQHLPDVFPESYKSASILEGDGESVGTVRSWSYVLPGTTKVLEAKGRTEVIDDENMVMVVDIFEGCHKDHYSVFIITMKVIPKGEGCVVKWTLEFDKHSEGGGEAPHYMELFSQITEKIDAHLLAKE